MSELHLKLGRAFKAERERCKLDIDTLSDELKISAGNLEAIERGDPDLLPEELYYSLFTKSYAERLGIDLEATIEAIKEEIGIPLEPSAVTKIHPHDANEFAEASSDEAASTERSTPAKGSGVLPIGMGVTVFLSICVGTYGLFSSAVIGDGAASEGQLRDALIPEMEAYGEKLASYDWHAHSTAKEQPLILTLNSIQESWATVLADGDTAIYRTLEPGRLYSVSAQYRLLVSIGIPSVVKVKLDGREVSLRNKESRRISRVEINQVNKEKFPARAGIKNVAPAQASPPASADSSAVDRNQF